MDVGADWRQRTTLARRSCVCQVRGDEATHTVTVRFRADPVSVTWEEVPANDAHALAQAVARDPNGWSDTLAIERTAPGFLSTIVVGPADVVAVQLK